MKNIPSDPTPLRQSFIHYLTLHRKAGRTVNAYVSFVYDLTKFHHRSPDQLGTQDIQGWLYHMIAQRKLAPSTVNTCLPPGSNSHFAERGCVQSTSRSTWCAESLGIMRTCCGWSERHSRAPGQNENCWPAGRSLSMPCARSAVGAGPACRTVREPASNVWDAWIARAR